MSGKPSPETPAEGPQCSRCNSTGWVCEAHSDRPWDGAKACGCGGAGMPCPPATYPTKTTRRGFRRAFNQTTTSHYLVIFPNGYLNDDSGEPIYRIKHVDKGTAESARESELVKE